MGSRPLGSNSPAALRWVERLESRLLLSTAWTVTSTADDGGIGTLRYAIDHSAAGDSIQFDAGILNAPSQTSILLNGTQLEISHDLSIAGPGANLLAVRGRASRVLAIDAGATVDISGVELRDGYAGPLYGGDVFVASGASLRVADDRIAYAGAARGGGIYNAGSVSLSNTDISNNGGGGDPSLGGGIYNDALLTVSGCTFENDQYFTGGAIYNAGTMTVAASSFSYNWVLASSQASAGGAIKNAASGSATITDSLFSQNTAIYGGAISNSGAMSLSRTTFEYDHTYHSYNLYGPYPAGGGAIFNDGTLDLTNSTIYENWAPDAGGGGIYVAGSAAVTITNTTINANNSPGGGGIFAEAGASVALHNNIVSGNSYSTNGDNSQTPSDIAGSVMGSFNLIGAGGSGGLADGIDGNIVGAVDPGLAPLFMNGGLTPTMALRAASPAFDAGSAVVATDAAGNPLTTDQRGRPRVAGGTVDIGAYEAQSPVPPTMVAAVAGADEVQVSWAADPDAATFNVYRTTDPGAPPASPIAAGIVARGFLDTSVTAGVTYYYTVTAVNAMAEGMASPASAATPFLPVIQGTPGDDTIRLTPAGDQQHVNWTLGTDSGKVRIDDPNGLTINGNGGDDTIVVFNGYDLSFPNLTIFNGTFTITGRLVYPPLPGQTWDLNRSTVYLPHSATDDTVALIRDELLAAYDGGAWDGAASPATGVITSTAARNDTTRATAIGYADAADGTGVNTHANTVEIRYTVMGDTNLDRVVNATDAVTMARNYLIAGRTAWDLGNFNYDATINLSDATILRKNFNATATGSVTAAEATLAASTGPAAAPQSSLIATPVAGAVGTSAQGSAADRGKDILMHRKRGGKRGR